MKTILLALPALLAVTVPNIAAREARVSSPDGTITVTVTDDNRPLQYSIAIDGRTIVEPSAIALEIEGVKPAGKITKATVRNGISEHIEAPFYRQREFDITYNTLTLNLDNGTALEWRVFDDGAAYRHVTRLKGDSITVVGETARFNMAGDPTVWLPFSTNKKNPMASAFQAKYDVTKLSQAPDRLAFLPATADMGGGVKLTILESDLESYPGMYLQADSAVVALDGVFAPYPASSDYHAKRRQLYVTDTYDYIARTKATRTFPWRIMAITRRDIDMPVNNLVYALAAPSRVDSTGWIAPGKVAWDWWNDWGLRGVPFEAGINNDTYKYYIDFASRNGIEYVVLDEGWYDPASGDMLTVIDDIDLPALIEYGRERGVGIVLWTVFNVLDDQLEEACAKYAEMGVKGFKVDFLDRDDQTAVDMTFRIADAAARHRLFLDYHGIYKPVGLSRTYPNVLNYEGVFGMEEVKWTSKESDFPLYDVTFPYIRLMAGQVDYTPGAMRNANRRDWAAHYHHPMSMCTRAHQLSSYIIHDSPFTMLCDSPSNYATEQESVDFITSLPVTFDETRVVDGRLGEYIITARRAGDNWYVGGATNGSARYIDLKFDFLPEDATYTATIMTDGRNAERDAEDYTIMTIENVTSKGIVQLHMAPGGGFVMRILPATDKKNLKNYSDSEPITVSTCYISVSRI